MRFDIFQRRSDAHLRKARDVLQQANLARLEHQLAAEHHAALATMYEQRVAWLEQEIAHGLVGGAWPAHSVAPKQVDGPKRNSASVVSWLRAHHVDNTNLPESA